MKEVGLCVVYIVERARLEKTTIKANLLEEKLIQERRSKMAYAEN